MFSKVQTAVILGVDSCMVQVEADVRDGLPMFTIVGFASSQVRESQERVRAALRNSGFFLPSQQVTINLAPADIRKEGAGFDLPIALAVLASMNWLQGESFAHVLVAGELGLNGEVHRISGILPIVLRAKAEGIRVCVVPRDNVREGQIVEGIHVVGVGSLAEAVDFFSHPEKEAAGKSDDTASVLTGEGFNGKSTVAEKPADTSSGGLLCQPVPSGAVYADETVSESAEKGVSAIQSDISYTVDFSEIQGQETAKRGAVIAAAGFHNFLMVGPPGAGKTMIARRIPTIMPPPDREECLEISRIYSIAGLLSDELPLMRVRPYRAPHHTTSATALAGGGRYPRPGEITLAHRGVLFLDELPEFSRQAIEILRQPLEEREIYIARANASYHFPADFMLVAAMNPCACGYYPDMTRCTCTIQDIERYRGRISRPLMDRIDLCVEVSPVTFSQLRADRADELSSARMRKMVQFAQERQRERYRGESFCFNSELPAGKTAKYCQMSLEAERVIERGFHTLNLSARGYHRVLKTARTIADLDGADIIEKEHVTEALCFRSYEVK